MLFAAPQLARRAFAATLALTPSPPPFGTPPLRHAAASVTARALSAPLTLELDPTIAVVASVIIVVAMSRPLSAFQAALVRNLNLTAQALLVITSLAYLVAGVGATLAYQQCLMGMSFSYLLSLCYVIFTWDE